MVSYRQCTADEVGVSARFKALEANGLIERRLYNERPRRTRGPVGRVQRRPLKRTRPTVTKDTAPQQNPNSICLYHCTATARFRSLLPSSTFTVLAARPAARAPLAFLQFLL